MSKNTRNPALIELIIVIFFFSISSVTVVKLFMASYEISQRSGSETLALIKTQDIIEKFKAAPQAYDEFFVEWEKDENKYITYFDDKMNPTTAKDAKYILEASIDHLKRPGGSYVRINVKTFKNSVDKEILIDLQAGSYLPEDAL